MTDIALRSDATNTLTTWAEEARLTHQIAISLAGTSFVPKSMQGRPDEVTGAILAGRELGLSPMAALRSIDIIDGTPAVRAVALRGIVLSHGHEMWVEDSTSVRAVVCGRRAGSDKILKSVWTIERAQKAGLATRKPWLAHPTAMLVARATAECARLVAADALIGMPYASEELADGRPDGDEPAPTTRRRRLKPVPEPLPAPELPAAPQQTLSDAGRRRLTAAYRDAGIDTRAARLAHASRALGREVATVEELSEAEADQLVAELPTAWNPPPDDAWPQVTTPPEPA